MKMKWNNEQQLAIYTKNKNILISASAGAGKTAVLIARLMHLIKDEKVPITRILAMTFSEAAAMEMKKRLAKALHQSIQEENSSFLKEQLANLDVAQISTIHGFCLSIIQEYYYMIGLSKQRVNQPLDDAQVKTLQTKAMNKVINQAYTTDEYVAFSLNFTNRAQHEGSLVDEIRALATIANAKPDPLIYLDECKQNYYEIDTLDALPQDILEQFYQYFILKVEAFIQFTNDLAKDMDEFELYKPRVGMYETALKQLYEHDYDAFRYSLMTAMKQKLPPSTKSVWVTAIQEQEEALLEILYPSREYIHFHNQTIKSLHYFITLTKQYILEYNKNKEAANGIDFNDMEQFAIQILRANDGYVAKKYQDKFYTIMVDEFQDSNEVQNELVKLIARSNNVFRVGDLKQSIYGFRHASPQIMKSLIDYVDPEFDMFIAFKNNYRSKENIVAFNNLMFERLMGLDALQFAFKPIDIAYIGMDNQSQDNVPIQLHILDKKELDVDKIYSSNELKALYIAKQIQEKVQSGYQFKDIVILVRSHAKMVEIKKILDEYNIPCFYNKKSGFYTSQNVETVIQYLKALVNPYDEIAFASILTSPLYQKSVAELAQIHLAKGDLTFMEYLQDDSSMQSFYTIKKQVYRSKLSEIIQQIYAIQDFYMEYTTLQEKANLDMLYELICKYEKEEAMSIQGFLRYLEKQKDAEVAEAMPIGENDDVVRIMTIHKSKGLEFKVVYLYSSSRFKSPEGNGCVSIDESLRLGMKYLDTKNLIRYPTITTIAIKQKQLQQYLEEELRILYVATTRAQKELHIVDLNEIKDLKEYTIHEFFKLQGYTGWIRKVLLDEVFTVKQHFITSMWELQQLPQQTSEYEVKKYKRKIEALSYMSPSDTEMKLTRPDTFHLGEDLGFERGTNLHKMAECMKHAPFQVEELYEVAKRWKIELTSHDVDVLLGLGNQVLYQKALQCSEVYHEYPFMVKREQTIIHGYMDFVAIDQDKVIMIDYKSDRGVDSRILLERYSDQIKEYKKALEQIYPNHQVNTYIYSFEHKEMVEIT